FLGTIESMEKAIKEEWDKLIPKDWNKYIDCMSYRLQKVKDQKGMQTEFWDFFNHCIVPFNLY
ncbi:hypothetical protein L873DRAFT_1704873, partial [Choiromyces venosus 120613-1]